MWQLQMQIRNRHDVLAVQIPGSSDTLNIVAIGAVSFWTTHGVRF